MLGPLGILSMCLTKSFLRFALDLSFSTEGYMLAHNISLDVSVLHTSVRVRKCVQESKVKGTEASQDLLQGVRKNEDT